MSCLADSVVGQIALPTYPLVSSNDNFDSLVIQILIRAYLDAVFLYVFPYYSPKIFN